MPFRPPLLLAALAVVAGCTSSPSMLECAGDAECGAGNVCVQGACVVNAPPVGAFEPPAAATTNRAYAIVPASSDPEGRAVTNGWSVKAMAGGCEPDTEPAADGGLEVIFWCAGTYELTLVPVDDLGLAGAAVVRSFEVAAAIGAPSVTAGPAIAATHACVLAVPSCLVRSPEGAISLQLSAVGSDPAGSDLTFSWKGIPPIVPSKDPTLLITFVPAGDVASPLAAVANGSGGPISGAYRFRVRVRNTQGLVAQAVQEVLVGNRAPVAALGPKTLPHVYADGQFVAAGDVVISVVDRDGDALFYEGSLAPEPTGGCTETVGPSAHPSALHVSIACSTATELIGDVARTLSVTITDSNGAATTEANALTIGNRPPKIVLSPTFAGAVLKVDHRVGPCQIATGDSCFIADGADPFVVEDPDGDPVTAYALAATVEAGRTRSKGSASLVDGVGRFRFETPVKHALEFRSALGVTGFVVSATALDGFGAVGSLAAPLLIANRPPVVKEPAPTVSVNHSYDAAARRYQATASGALFEDPDGDPLSATITPEGPCGSVTMAAGRATIGCQTGWNYELGGVPPLGAFLAGGGVLVTASDGWEQVETGTYVTILDRPATVTVPVTSIDHCACGGAEIITCGPSGEGAVVPVTLVDPDGDPSLVEISGTFVDYTVPPTMCLPGSCGVTTNIPSEGTTAATVTADTGAAGPHPQVNVGLSVTCSGG